MGALVGAAYALTPGVILWPKSSRATWRVKSSRKPTRIFSGTDQEANRPLRNIPPLCHLHQERVFYTVARQAPISEEDFIQNINFYSTRWTWKQRRFLWWWWPWILRPARVVLREGALQKAVSASCAIPGILPRWSWGSISGGRGWINRVPISPLRKMGADLTIAVDVAEGINESLDFDTGLDIVLRTYDITQTSLSQLQLKEADILIRPSLEGIRWADFHRFEECLKAGEEAQRKIG
jgi:NTE family protein